MSIDNKVDVNRKPRTGKTVKELQFKTLVLNGTFDGPLKLRYEYLVRYKCFISSLKE